MNRQTSADILVIGLLLSAAPAFGQFFAPDTEYHDLAQRCFVVEAARVLAWRENEPQLKIVEVTFEVTMTPARETSWRIRWLGPEDKLVRELTVSYPESLLNEGPRFYRSVFEQIWKAGWREPKRIAATNLVTEFWLGANQAGFSRAESLQAAWKFEQSKPTEERGTPFLAGLLQSAALPASGEAVSLDALLLARGAAWLCLAEKMSTGTNKFETCWAPTLLLAGRENTAVSVWKAKSQGSPLAGAGPVSDGWDFLLRRPRAKAAFVYAAAKEHRPFTMPIMAYYGRVAPLGSTPGDLMYPIFATDQQTVVRIYDYAPFLSRMGVAGGRVLEGLLPALARLAWLEAMEAQPLSSLDYNGHKKMLSETRAKVTAAIKKGPAEDSDASLLGLAEESALLTEAHNAGVGPLIPTGVATARDLLNYGWESTCLQMEERHRFVNGVWGIRDLALSILTNTVEKVRGSSTVLRVTSSRSSPREEASRLSRIQFADSAGFTLRAARFPVWGTSVHLDRVLYSKRCWLRPSLVGFQFDGLVQEEEFREIIPWLTRIHAEGGPLGDNAALQALVNMKAETAVKIPGKQKFQEELASSVIEPSMFQLNTVWDAKYKDMPFFQRGQELEKIFWDAPTTRIHSWIYHNYINSYADTSARRFYDQLAEMLNEPIGFANGIGQMRYAQAWLDNDRPAMKRTLESCDSGSYGNMQMLVWDAVVRDDLKALAEQVDEAIERYPRSSSQMVQLKKFLPLIPALRDPKHASHGPALEHFGKGPEWVFLRWIMIKQYQLSKDDAVRFLGGAKADLERQALVSFLARDKTLFAESFDKMEELAGARLVLILRLRKDLLEIPEPEGQKDLKPASAETIEQAVINSLK